MWQHCPAGELLRQPPPWAISSWLSEAAVGMAWIGSENASNAAMVERIAFIEIPPRQISEEDRIVLAEGCKWKDAVLVNVSGFPQPPLSEAPDHRCYPKREGSIYLAALFDPCVVTPRRNKSSA
jgi:hypothetical protein